MYVAVVLPFALFWENPPGHHRNAAAKWLVGTKFDFRFEDPGDGTLRLRQGRRHKEGWILSACGLHGRADCAGIKADRQREREPGSKIGKRHNPALERSREHAQNDAPNNSERD